MAHAHDAIGAAIVCNDDRKFQSPDAVVALHHENWMCDAGNLGLGAIGLGGLDEFVVTSARASFPSSSDLEQLLHAPRIVSSNHRAASPPRRLPTFPVVVASLQEGDVVTVDATSDVDLLRPSPPLSPHRSDGGIDGQIDGSYSQAKHDEFKKDLELRIETVDFELDVQHRLGIHEIRSQSMDRIELCRPTPPTAEPSPPRAIAGKRKRQWAAAWEHDNSSSKRVGLDHTRGSCQESPPDRRTIP